MRSINFVAARDAQVGFLRMIFNIIVNSARTGERQIKAAVEVFESAGKKTAVHRTQNRGHAKKIAEELTSCNEECAIVVMGGDGTLHEVINGIKNFEKCSLGLIPSGTGNDFAEAAGIPKDIKKAAQIIAFRAPENIDYIELSNGLKSINAVGMGIDVDVLKHAYAKKGGGKGKYLSSLIYCLAHFKSYNFTVEYDGRQEEHYGLIAALGNGRQIGGGIKTFPDAKIADGYMDILIVDYISRIKTIFAFLKLMRGRINAIKEVKAAKVKSAKFNTDVPCSIQAEGEIYDGMQLDAHIVEGGLRFYLPPHAD